MNLVLYLDKQLFALFGTELASTLGLISQPYFFYLNMVEALSAWYKGSLTPSISINAKMVQRQKHQNIMLIDWMETSSVPI